MLSDRKIMTLIRDVRSGKLPIQDTSTVTEVVETALNPIENMDFNYNPDGTLATLNTPDKTFKFIWNSDKTLSRITSRSK